MKLAITVAVAFLAFASIPQTVVDAGPSWPLPCPIDPPCR